MKKNWGPVWFELREAKGQSDLATIMYQDPGGPVVDENFPHREGDGLGRMLGILKKNGLEIKLQPKKLTPPPRWQNLYWLIRGLLEHPLAKKDPWVFWKSKPSEPPDQVSTITLTDEENSALKEKAARRQVSPSFYMLAVMTDLIRAKLYKDPKDEALWLFPVDLRGAFPKAALHELTLSFVPIKFEGRAQDSLSRDYQTLRKQLKGGQYWAFFALYNIGDYIGRRGMKALVDRTHEKSFWMGSFSDLGTWNQPEICESRFKDRVWQLSPPGSPSYPFGFTNIEWCGKRSLTMRIHPSVTEGKTTELAAWFLAELREHLRRP